MFWRGLYGRERQAASRSSEQSLLTASKTVVSSVLQPQEILPTTRELRRDPLALDGIKDLVKTLISVCDTLSRGPSQRVPRIPTYRTVR